MVLAVGKLHYYDAIQANSGSQGRNMTASGAATGRQSRVNAPFDRRTFVSGAVKLGVGASFAGTLLAGCGSGGGVGGTASLFDSFADEYFNDEVRGAREAAKALGLPIHDYTFGENASLQVSQVQDAVTRGIKTMGIYAPLGAGLSQMIAAAKGKAILAFEYDIPPWTYPSTYGPTYGFYVVPNIPPGAYEAGKMVLEAIGGKGNVVVMSAFPGGQDNEGCELGFEQALSEYPDVKVLAKAPGHFSRGPAQQLMSDWLTRFPKIDALLSYADTQSLGAYAAMQEKDRTDIKIASVNGQLEGLQAVKEGKIMVTVFTNPLLAGGWRTVKLYDLQHGWRPAPLERMFSLDPAVVSRANVEQYLKLVQTDPLPYDWKQMSRVLNPNGWESQGPWYPIDPEKFWAQRNLGTPQPASWLPGDVKTALASGAFEKLVQEYKNHIGTQPI
jgi:ribose transport system substrate-binding protein